MSPLTHHFDFFSIMTKLFKTWSTLGEHLLQTLKLFFKNLPPLFHRVQERHCNYSRTVRDSSNTCISGTLITHLRQRLSCCCMFRCHPNSPRSYCFLFIFLLKRKQNSVVKYRANCILQNRCFQQTLHSSFLIHTTYSHT